MIREMRLEDLDRVADLAQGERFARQGWEPEFWALAPAGRQLHPLHLRSLLNAGHPALVATSSDTVVGAVVAVRRPSGRLLVDDLSHAAERPWSQLCPPLLGALVSKAAASGVSEVIVPCARADGELAAALRGAGLDLVGWTRVGRIRRPPPSPPEGVRIAGDDDTDAVQALLSGQELVPHGMPGSSEPTEAVLLEDEDGLIGVALLGSLAPPPVYAPGGLSCLIEHRALRGGGPEQWERLIRGAEWFAARRGDIQVIVPVGPSHHELDRALDLLGYGRPVDWWRWAQPQPLVAPHSAQA